ncbi:MAG TPA: glycosyltransferase family 87 protein [Candidatus Sulfotelmatobacter sp.]|nr:glycosyltransferase family 87 protein [Candidatus Sulfotelmatobacter sp.]
MAVGMWLYVQRVLIPHQKNYASMQQSPRGNLSDLYPRWLGARELILHHRDPYSAEITRESQIGYYGRPLDPNRPGDPKDEQGFAYPVYVVFLLAPTITLPFSLVHEVFFWCLAVLTGASVLLWLRTLEWMPSSIATILWILLTINCWPAIQGLKLQQLSVLVAVLISAAMLALVRRHFLMAGTLLALATIKPQLVFLLVLWLGVWVIGNWRERQRALWSFAITMLLLIGAGELLLPGWIGEFRRAMKEYYRYTGGGISVLDVMLTPLWGRIAAALLVAMLLVVIWPNRRTAENTRAFQWSVCFTLTTTLLIIPMFAPYNQLLLLPSLMMAVRASRELWAKGRVSRFFVSITAVSVLWPFVTGTALVLALAFLPGQTVQKAWDLPFYTSFAIPITAYAMLLVSRPLLSSHPNAADAKAFRTLRQAAASE